MFNLPSLQPTPRAISSKCLVVASWPCELSPLCDFLRLFYYFSDSRKFRVYTPSFRSFPLFSLTCHGILILPFSLMYHQPPDPQLPSPEGDTWFACPPPRLTHFFPSNPSFSDPAPGRHFPFYETNFRKNCFSSALTAWNPENIIIRPPK